MTELSAVDIAPLRVAISGELVTKRDPGWELARRAWNLVVDQRPALVVLAESSQDVATTVRFAHANGLRVAPQSTGHGASSLGDLADVVLLRTDRLNGVSVDPAARSARVQAGARWADVIAPAAGHGLASLHGFSGGVGVAGYTLGGGIGWLARREGVASSHVRSLEVVTAEGEQRHVDAEHQPDLFWALRGGGGSPVVVTSLELELFPLREAFAGSLVWPIEQASAVVHAYRAWIATVPDSLTSTVRLMRYPPLPDVPEPLRGRTLVSITLVFTGEQGEGDELVAPLRETAPPYLDTLAMVPGAALADLSGDPPGPLPGIGGAVLLRTLAPEAVEAFVDLAGPDSQSPLTQLEIRHLGGALRSPMSDPGATGALDAEALVYGVGTPVTPEVGEAIRGALNAASERLSPWVAERPTLLTFDERSRGTRASLTSDAADRLAAIASAHDPDGLLVANHVAG